MVIENVNISMVSVIIWYQFLIVIFFKNTVVCKVMNGDHAGEVVSLPNIKLDTNNK